MFCHVAFKAKQARFFSCGGKSKANSSGGKSKADSFVSHVAVKAKSGLVFSLCGGKGKADPLLKCRGTNKAGSFFYSCQEAPVLVTFGRQLSIVFFIL